MTAFEQLLLVQEHDTRSDQLRHERETLPERAALAARERERADLDQEIAGIGRSRDAIARDLKAREDEVATVEARIATSDKALYGGAITSPREAVAMQEEIASLKRRLATLEDGVLELLEQLDPLDAQLSELGSRREEIETDAQRLSQAITIAEAELDVQIDAEAGERAQAVAGIEPALLDRYEQLRRQLKGIAVARLTAGTCSGCNLHLSAVEVDRIKHEPLDAVVTCEECGRILVRS